MSEELDSLLQIVNHILLKHPSIITKIEALILNSKERSIPTIHNRQIEISAYLDKIFNSTVSYGPFKGLKFPNKTWWGSIDRSSMLLGLYEKEVLESLQKLSGKFSTFIDLGAADGYYSIGVLINNMFNKTICYEISEKGREVINENALLNNVHDRIEIKGTATNSFYSDIPTEILSNSVLFIDIEGAEFDLMDEKTFYVFRNSMIFIEMHDWFFTDGAEKISRMKKDSKLTHNITELTMGSRDLSIFPELSKLSDSDRWLICSEGRGQLMTWFIFEPINFHE